jgi:hypothetical protein
MLITHQKVIWLDAKQFTEISKGKRCIRLEEEVTIMMSGSQVAALSAKKK